MRGPSPPWVDRTGRWRPVWANIPVAMFAVATLLMSGYGLASSVQQTLAIDQLPPLIPDLLRPLLGTGFVGFFIAVNSPCEWVLLPAAVLLNWRIPGRRVWILAGAALFYAFACGPTSISRPTSWTWWPTPRPEHPRRNTWTPYASGCSSTGSGSRTTQEFSSSLLPSSRPRYPVRGTRCHAGSTRAAPGDLLDLSVHVDDRALAAQRDHVDGGLDELLQQVPVHF